MVRVGVLDRSGGASLGGAFEQAPKQRDDFDG